ncbi:MAG TPA: DUF4350 domain-containing protein [Hymenobacter sp.]|jgi:hypothetical protein
MPQITTFRLYLLGIALLFGGYVVLEYNRPKPLDWTPTYANKDKIPYGTYVLYDQLPRLLGTDSIEAVRLPVYSQLTGLSLDDLPTASTNAASRETSEASSPDSTAPATSVGDSSVVAATDSTGTSDEEAHASNSSEDAELAQADPAEVRVDTTISEEETGPNEDNRSGAIPLRNAQANYLFINESFELSRPDAQALLQFVARGNDAFIAARSLRSGLLRDSLGVEVEDLELPLRNGPKGLPVADSVDLRFTNPALAHVRARLPGPDARQRLVVDSGRAGRTLATDAQGRAVFIRLDHGRGHFYLCSTPVAFTNYYLLRPRTTAFAAAALAYLPARRTWWDEYQKQGPIGEQSVLRVVFAHTALRQAYYLTLAGALLLVLVAARRRQRVIPTINPLPNTTLLFTRTVASLYRQGSSHTLIAEKKVGLFMDYLRTRFQETNPDFGDADFRERLSQKSGLTRSRVDELFRLVNFARTAPRMTDTQLLQLSKALSDFKREVNQ